LESLAIALIFSSRLTRAKAFNGFIKEMILAKIRSLCERQAKNITKCQNPQSCQQNLEAGLGILNLFEGF